MTNKPRTIDCTPTWEGVLPVLLEGLKSRNNEVYQNNMAELRIMAQLADLQNRAAITGAISALEEMIGFMTKPNEGGDITVLDPIYLKMKDKIAELKTN